MKIIVSFHPKTVLFSYLVVELRILSSEYQLYACGKILHAPRFRRKSLISRL